MRSLSSKIRLRVLPRGLFELVRAIMPRKTALVLDRDLVATKNSAQTAEESTNRNQRATIAVSQRPTTSMLMTMMPFKTATVKTKVQESTPRKPLAGK